MTLYFKSVLSLFDGMSCGQVALNRAGIKYEKYYSSEIDKFAIQIANKNYPDTIQLGDITKWQNWDIDYSQIDLIFAGFPCQAWSVAGLQGGDTDPRGALVYDLIAIWERVKRANPDVLFLFENVRMKKEFEQFINNLFGIEPILINSALVSAQMRKRLYWTNIGGLIKSDLFGACKPNISQPKDKGMLLKDILEDKKQMQTAVITGGALQSRYTDPNIKGVILEKVIERLEPNNIPKSNAITTVGKDSVVVYRNQMQISEDNIAWRKLTPIECERLQTLPDNYTEGVSNSQRYKMLGNGWTVDVIAHILAHAKKVLDKE